MRVPSVTDQLLNKAKRIRQIEDSGVALVHDSVDSEFVGLVNYSIIGLIQLELHPVLQPDITTEEALAAYDKYMAETFRLMQMKNHDYGEAWRQMRVSSMTDLILMKLKRIKQIEDNDGKTLISEGVEGGYMDIINYSLFCLIRLDELRTEN